MKYLLIAALLLAFGAFGKLIGSGVGPAEDERRAKWQGKRLSLIHISEPTRPY